MAGVFVGTTKPFTSVSTNPYSLPKKPTNQPAVKALGLNRQNQRSAQRTRASASPRMPRNRYSYIKWALPAVLPFVLLKLPVMQPYRNLIYYGGSAFAVGCLIYAASRFVVRGRAVVLKGPGPMVAFISYGARSHIRATIEEALLREGGEHWSCDGGGTILTPLGEAVRVTDVVLHAPEERSYERLIQFLRSLNLTATARVKSPFGEIEVGNRDDS